MNNSIPSAPLTPAPSVFVIGPTGSGKTTSIRTLPMAGLETFVLFTENSMEIVADIPCPNLHWHYAPPGGVAGGMEEVLNRTHAQIDLPWKVIQADVADPAKGKYATVWYEFLYSLYDFRCDRCGQSFGDVTTWGHDRALVVDGMSGINTMAIQSICGAATTRDKSQWGAAMESELAVFGRKLTYDTKCLYVLIGHTRRVFNEDAAQKLLVPDVIGQANLSQWTKAFNDVVLAKRYIDQGQPRWFWDTATTDADVKARNVPVDPWLAPDFGPLLNNWRAKFGE